MKIKGKRKIAKCIQVFGLFLIVLSIAVGLMMILNGHAEYRTYAEQMKMITITGIESETAVEAMGHLAEQGRAERWNGIALFFLGCLSGSGVWSMGADADRRYGAMEALNDSNRFTVLKNDDE